MSANTPPPADDRIYSNEAFAAEVFWEKNRQTIFIGVAVVVLAVLAVAWWLISSHNAKLAAQAAFAEASTPEAWQEVINRYGGTMPAANAMFLLAESLRTQGKIDESSALYSRLLSEFPNHPLGGGARLGLAENLSAAGKTTEAIAALQAAESAGGYAAPFAALLQGRILINEGKLSEARDVFTKIVQTHQKSPLAQLAYAQAEQLQALAPPAPAAVLPASPLPAAAPEASPAN